MTKAELLRALEPFDDETFIAAQMPLADKTFYEFNIAEAIYVPMAGEMDAYIALRLRQ